MNWHLRTVTMLILTALVMTAAGASARTRVDVSPDTLDFGEIPVGQTDSLAFTLTNAGTDSVVLLKRDLEWAYIFIKASVSQDTVRLAPGQECRVWFRLTPLFIVGMTDLWLEYQSFGVNNVTVIIEYKYHPVASDLYLADGQGWEVSRSLHEHRLRVTGSRVAELQDAEVRIVPEAGVTVGKVSTDQSQIWLGVTVEAGASLGVRRVVFETGGTAQDSVFLYVRPSIPIPYPIDDDSLFFGPQKSLDTLTFHGFDFWPGCRFEFSTPGLSLVSTELFPDTLAQLVLRLDQSLADTVVDLLIANPDSGASLLQISIEWNPSALPLEPESGAPGAALPRAFSLGANVPNPFNPSTTISYSVGGEAPLPVHLLVFNIRGQVVATLVDRVVAPGQYTVNWDGRGRGGEKLSSGVYFYRITAGDFSFTRKMVLLK
ncbi:T9SS type A sorting domain-containing protein [bacterium]|nr:T9SS type A sorting domain-containing protein [bacterium]